jgi:uncharacterized protein YwgA
MDRQQIGVKLVMDALGLLVKTTTFNDRLILQKAIYLSQAKGIDLGYFYQWYLYGPYCPSLVRDASDIEQEIVLDIDDSKSWSLDKDSLADLEDLKSLIPEDDNERKKALELLASVHFLVDRKQVSGKDENEITETLRRFKKDFTKKEVKKAIGDLSEHALFPT